MKKFPASRRFILLQWLLTFLAAMPIVLFTYLLLDSRVQDYYREHLQVRSRNLLATYRNGGARALQQGINERLTGGGQKEAAYLLLDARGKKLAGNVLSWPASTSIPAIEATAQIQRQGHSRPEWACVNTYKLGTGEWFLSGSVRLADKKTEQAIIEQILIALLVMLPVALIVSRVREAYVSRRVKDITVVASAISSGDLSRRIDAGHADDDFKRIASALNRTFARLQILVEDLGFVTNALAHELRSPLTRVRVDLERSGSAKGLERKALLDRISNEIEGMLRTINATLDLTRAESEIGVSSFASFDMSELLADLWEVYEASAEERNVVLIFKPSDAWQCFGNRDLIAQAISNLLDNALKHSGGTQVELGSTYHPPACSVWVSDNGVGISADERSEALRKFGRLDRARTSHGIGLGLAFVRAVTDLHNGELALEDNHPGLRVTIKLPLNSAGNEASPAK